MKNFLIFFVTLFLSTELLAAQPCTVFSGSFKKPDTASNQKPDLVIEQDKCESLMIRFFIGEKEEFDFYNLDGKMTKHFEDPNLSLISYAAAYPLGSDIIIDYENHWGHKIEKAKRRLHLNFLQNKKVQLMDQYGRIRNDGVFVPDSQELYLRE